MSISEEKLFLGIDVGTGGVRAMAVSDTGHVAAEASVAFGQHVISCNTDCHEQSPEAWWQAACQATAALGDVAKRITAVAVDGTSGTLVALDRLGYPLRPALMYNDPRGNEEAQAINVAAGEFCEKLGYRFASSFALAKILWLKNHEPEVFEKTARFVHQADYLVECLTAQPATSDYSNALKTGYDLVDESWPAWIGELLGGTDRLPSIVAPGTKIGVISNQAAGQTGLPKGLPVVTGATDGTAACLASGIRRPGDYNTTLGTTLVFKGLSRQICRHPDGLIYSHKLPGGLWLPGAAGNTGCQWIGRFFPEVDPKAMDAAAEACLPVDMLAYPLARTGERFPFLCQSAQGFAVPETDDPTEHYAACLQGVAFIERLSYEVLDQVASATGGEVFSTGGGSRSDVWTQCRSDATGRVIHRPVCGESAFGSAILAAAGTFYDRLDEATERMVRIEKTFTPNHQKADRYEELFGRFRDQLHQRGYV